MLRTLVNEQLFVSILLMLYLLELESSISALFFHRSMYLAADGLPQYKHCMVTVLVPQFGTTLGAVIVCGKGGPGHSIRNKQV